MPTSSQPTGVRSLIVSCASVGEQEMALGLRLQMKKATAG